MQNGEIILQPSKAYSSEAPGDTVLQYTKYERKTLTAQNSNREKTMFSLVKYAQSFPEFKAAYQAYNDPPTFEERHDKLITFGRRTNVVITDNDVMF